MSFATPLWLAVALLAGAVLLLHTMRQTQHVVPSLYLWKRLQVMHAPRRSLVPPQLNLLLILQILAVLGLAAALAYPILGGSGARPAHHVLVLDRSASMGISAGEENRFADALAAARAEIESLQRAQGDLVSVIATGAGTSYLAARQQPGAALAALDGLPEGEGAPDWNAVAQRIPGLLAEDEPTTITVFSDDGEAARAALAPVAGEEGVVLHASPGAAGRNFGVSASAVPGERANAWTLSGTVAGDAGAEDEEPPALTLRFRPLDNSPALDWAVLELQRDNALSRADRPVWSFSTEVSFPTAGLAEFVLPEDAGTYDNLYRLMLGDPAAKAQVLYIGPGNRTAELALLATGLVDVFVTDTVPENVASYDLVVVENAVLDARPATNVLWLGSARLAGQEAPTRGGAEITHWDGEHPLSRALDWRAVEAMDSYVFPADPAAHAVLSAGDTPLLSAKTLAEGRDIRLALAVGETGWTTGSALPTLVVNAIHWLDTGIGSPVTGCEAGTGCVFPARLAGAEIRDAEGVVLRPASAQGDDAALLDGSNSFVPEEAGLYSIVGADGETALVLVNPAAAEIGALAAVAVESEDAAGSEGVAVPLWVWFALAVAVLLVIEAVLALRRREGFGRTAQLAADAAAVRRKRWALGLRVVAIALIALAPLMLPFPGLAPAQRIVAVTAPEDAGLTDSACSGFGPGGVGQVALAAQPEILRDASCGAADPLDPDATLGAATGMALELAAALVPAGEDGRIVLASAAAGGVDSAAARLVARGLPVDVVATDRDQDAAWVSELTVPQMLRDGDAAPITAVVGMGAAGPAEIAFGVGDREISRGTFDLAAGANRIDARVPDLEEGEALFWAEIRAEGEAMPANGRMEVLRAVLPRPRIGIVTPEEEWGRYMADALEVQGLDADVIGPRRAPFWMYQWLADYDGAILMNVPAIDLDTRQQELLDEYVRVHGRGLLILGGENTFGPGGYFQTPLESISPLSSRVPQEAPVVALAFVLDRSGSMQATVEGVTRLDIAKQATISAVELLNPESQVSVIVFDENASVLVPMMQKDDGAIAAALNRLDPGGGTSIAPGLAAALDQMEVADAPIRHVVVMSDGLTQPGDFDALMQRAAAMDVTVSTVAIGEGADVGRLADLARLGGGSSHATRDFRALPGILSQEAMMLGGESFETGTFPVAWIDRDAEFLDGLPDQLPPLSGYVLTSEKEAATLHLATQDADGELVPILASWRYGNGHVMALATHAVGPGSIAWQELPQFPQLYGQPMRHFLSDAPGPGLTVQTSRADDALVIEADALNRNGEPVPGLAPIAELRDQTGTLLAEIALRPEAPGVYLGQTGPLAPGRYSVAVDAGREPAQRTALVGETDVIVSFSAALDPLRAAPERLLALAGATGGAVLESPPDFGTGMRAVLEPAWRPWLVLGLALFLVDLALRYAPGLFARRRRYAPAAPAETEDNFVLPRAA